MKRLFRFAALSALVATSHAWAQPEGPQQGNPRQTEEWVKGMHADAIRMLDEAKAEMAKGHDDVALNRMIAAQQMYRAALSEQEHATINADIAALRAKLGVTDPNQPKPPKQIDLNNPEIATRNTEAMRLLSEAEQHFEEGRFHDAGQMFTRLYAKFLDVLSNEDEARVTQGLMTSRERLGLPPMPAGDSMFIPYLVKSGDEEIDSLCILMSGSYGTDPKLASAESPRLTFSSAAVKVNGLTNAVYFEVAREDDAANPFRQGVLTMYRMDKQLRLRVLDLSNENQRGSVVGLWAAADVFPALELDELTINADLVVNRNDDGSGYTARTSGRVPTLKGGAVMMTSIIKVTSDGLTIDDRGYNAEGKEVWRSGSEAGVSFVRSAMPAIVTRKDSGVIIITLAPGTDTQKLIQGGQLAMQFSYWAANGTLVETSRAGSRPMAPMRYPINAIPGLNEGLEGLPLKARRRIYVPADQGWGAAGNGWRIPPNSPVIFDIECMWLQEPIQPPAPTPLGPVQPGEEGAAPSTPPTPRPTGGH